MFIRLLAIVLPFAVAAQSDPVTGLWEGQYAGKAGVENPIRVELRLDGSRVDGFVMTEAEKLPIEKGAFDPNGSAIHFEVEYRFDNHRYIIDGVVKPGEINGTWKHESDGGLLGLRRTR